MKHTPTPWKFERVSEEEAEVSGPDGRMICAMSVLNPPDRETGERIANIEFCALACSSYYELLAACQSWVDYFDQLDAHSDPDDPMVRARTQYHRKRIEATRSAIKSATP